MDDVCAIIGFSATVRLIAWHGGSHIYVPGEATPGHPLVALMGFKPALISKGLRQIAGNAMLVHVGFKPALISKGLRPPK